jgi:hypothetical protein
VREERAGVPADPRRVRDELRPTGNAQAPWVGLLRYCEQTPSKSTIVTEIFRYQANKWMY